MASEIRDIGTFHNRKKHKGNIVIRISKISVIETRQPSHRVLQKKKEKKKSLDRKIAIYFDRHFIQRQFYVITPLSG